MNTPTKLGGFTLAAAVVFGAAFGIGQAAGSVGGGEGGDHDAGHGSAEPAVEAAGELPAGGLLISQDGYRLQLASGIAAVGAQEDLTFRILRPEGTVTEFTPTHDKRMHLIVARRDLTGFRHVHPTMSADGTWSVPFTFDTAGAYRVFADFQPTGREDALTLGADVAVGGNYTPLALSAPNRTATVDGYVVSLDGTLEPGRTSKLTLTVTKDGNPVTDLQPYLAAYGHLVALREGDLAYLHVHPDGEPGDGRTPPGPDITFYAEIPSAGNYRLFLDFQHGNVVRTAEFTMRAGGEAAGQPAPEAASQSEQDGHGWH